MQHTALALLTILLITQGCWKSEQQKAVESLESFLENFTYQPSEPLLQIARKSQRAASFLAPKLQLSLKHRERIYSINSSQQFKEHYLLLRRVTPNLQVAKPENPRITAQGSGYLIKTALKIKSTDGEDTLFYQFSMEKIEDKWLIKSGLNEPLFD